MEMVEKAMIEGKYTTTFKCEKCAEAMHIVSSGARKDRWDVLDNWYGYGRVVAIECDRCHESLVTVQKLEFNKEARDYRASGEAVIARHWKPYPRHKDFENVTHVSVDGKEQGAILNINCSKMPISIGFQDEGDVYKFKRCFIGNGLMNQVVELRDIKHISIVVQDMVMRHEHNFNSLDEVFDCK